MFCHFLWSVVCATVWHGSKSTTVENCSSNTRRKFIIIQSKITQVCRGARGLEKMQRLQTPMRQYKPCALLACSEHCHIRILAPVDGKNLCCINKRLKVPNTRTGQELETPLYDQQCTHGHKLCRMGPVRLPYSFKTAGPRYKMQQQSKRQWGKLWQVASSLV